MTRNYAVFIRDIIKAMEDIENFVAGKSLEELRGDEKTLSAVLWKLGIIGEAAKNVPHHLRQKWSDIPWKDMAGMRDRLIHAYFGIDYRLVWEAIQTRIPQVKPRLEAMLVELERGSGG